MNELKIGFAREIINPEMGAQLAGYGDAPRPADGILDNLELNVMAVSCKEKTVLFMSYDLCHLLTEPADRLREMLSKELSLPADSLFLAGTHTHTGPRTDEEYMEILMPATLRAAKNALADLRPARMGYKVGTAPNVAFVRRFRMKDGSVQTNPGLGNPNIAGPIGDVDLRVNVLRFDREEDTIVLVNFGNHPDTVGGTKISADWPGFLRRTVEKTLENTKCIFFNGAEGDVNHINVHAKDGELNGTFNDFDDVYRGYDHARFMGRAMAGTVLQVFDKVNYRDVESLKTFQKYAKVPANLPKPSEMEKAHLYMKLADEGRTEEIPFKGMELTTAIFEAKRMVRLEHGPEFFNVLLTGISIGPLAFLGVQGEPFTEIGRAWKETEGFEMILPGCNVNGKEGYFPTNEAYQEGGYEARSSQFRAGVQDILVREGKEVLEKIK